MGETVRDRWRQPKIDRRREAKPVPLSTSLCMVSNRFRFIYVLIPKNASSTLRAELRRDLYECEELRYSQVDSARRQAYFAFTFLRPPVTRLLSAYQEISMRFESSPSSEPRRRFFTMDEGPARFLAFLDAAEEKLWDDHIRLQEDFVRGASIDYFGTLERFQFDLAKIFARLGIEACPTLPMRRSRASRAQRYRYAKFLIDESELDASTLARIHRLLASDLRFYAERIAHP